MADDIHEINAAEETIPPRPTLIEARGEAATLTRLMREWVRANDMNNRYWAPGGARMMTPKTLRQRLENSGG